MIQLQSSFWNSCMFSNAYTSIDDQLDPLQPFGGGRSTRIYYLSKSSNVKIQVRALNSFHFRFYFSESTKISTAKCTESIKAEE